MIYSDFDLTKDDVSIQGYGFIGKTEFQNGYAVFETSGSLEKVGYMTIYVRFENCPFEASPAVVLDLEAIKNNSNDNFESTQNEQEEPQKKIRPIMITCIVIGGVVVVTIIIVIIIICIKKNKLKKKKREKKGLDKIS